MSFLFSIARILQVAYTALRAAISIMLVAHGAARWVRNKRAGPA